MTERFALIHNPRSRRNGREDGTFRKRAARALGALFVHSATRTSLPDIVADLARREVGVIAIDGGDGTVSDVMSAIYRFYPADSLPALVVLPSGNTNLIAADVGFGLRGSAALERLTALARDGHLRRHTARRDALTVRWSDPARPATLGMFHGAAAFTRGIRIAHRPVLLNRFSHDLAVGMAIASSVGRLLLRSTRRKWLAGDPVTLTVGQDAPRTLDCFLFLATTLCCLPGGMWPFTSHNGAGLSYLNVHAFPERLAAATWSSLRGDPGAWMDASPSYDRGRTDRLGLRIGADFVLDGETLDSGPDGQTFLSAGPAFDFIRGS
ncbi:diacylglycerol kinase catalytic region [Gluconacetobacter diazotrophicus PA1 5]|uniref:Putative diacylglycerol kinase (DAG) catalytic domain protein n=1 Tax=Gluconacetobacter diazotrophicus (strain ATCC 49037 / DSM 5601 / CCUG 37298 / CIP 103539 / LMG 7603 / PAl5) TaxID=272568 RepID=A9HRC4_GLUDA|nr:diacylglycerol kinase family protein [Gluconacetobacter diazotrophicus]ACI53145.1 diacylglycerol kinase catalytic region [Gluconacetobacter diazotrophicus PA1 5]TWB05579.1 diacylglycerol kinase-like protein [Gluconacetobacter diazotrophicus]CAP56873.1 putative diacylglycerol kinase (DAG) catalytic domain protein [Gluconacetobacter diazotrophicus PA1 5]